MVEYVVWLAFLLDSGSSLLTVSFLTDAYCESCLTAARGMVDNYSAIALEQEAMI